MPLETNVDCGGISLKNPCMLAAGVLGTTGASMNRVFRCGAGGVVSKSVSMEGKPGNPGPVVISTGAGWINSMGLPNPGASEFIDELREVDEEVPLVCSVFGETPGRFVEVVKRVEGVVDAVELNLSCPNIEGGIISSRPSEVERFTSAVVGETDLPVWVKLTPNVSDITMTAKAAEKAGADAIVAINTVRGMVIDIETQMPVLGNKVGGLSGEQIHPIAVEAVYRIYRETDIPVIGVGGVSNTREAIEMILAGAQAIQIGSAVQKDIEIFKKINMGIKKYMQEKNIQKISEFRGNAHQTETKNP
ncbi:MAG: dihydroorotate dehydrogenase [Methanonatronarchaeia archaeon]|nr:MAG: dihydroorotate dehydrogenase [Methanonatronarchaeia archaeon]